MEQIKLKTSLKCNGCLATVTPYLNQLEGLGEWSVDLSDPNRTLTAEVSGICADDVIAVIGKAGFSAEKIG
jgi:copper chaperone